MSNVTRRSFVFGAAAALPLLARAPASPVSVLRCRSYDPAVLAPALDSAFDGIGGLGSLVRNKTVAIKLNLNGGPTSRLAHLPLGMTHWPHPHVIAATVNAIERAGARRIRLLESAWAKRPDPLEENLYEANWDVHLLRTAARRVEFENTNWLAGRKRYARFPVPGGGMVYPAYDLSPAYEECDVFVSIAKPKDHTTTGVTLGIKNLFGMTPCTVYGSAAGEDEPSEWPYGSRLPILHYGKRQPPRSAPQERSLDSSRDDQWRIPRILAELSAARPVHLSIIDGVYSMAGGQNPGQTNEPVAPGFLAAGRNIVCTDAVTMALMNYDPMADRGATPFVGCDNHLRLAEELGVGARDLRQIEVVGVPIEQARYDFAALRKKIAARRAGSELDNSSR